MAALAGAALLAGCGDEDRSPEEERLYRAEERLADGPRTEAREWAEVIRASYAAANAHVNTDTGEYEPEARKHLERADSAWPWYVNVSDKHPKPEVAAIMVKVFGEGLDKPDKAAVAARMLAREDPSVASYLQWAQWSVRAGDRHSAEEAGEGAVERAKPADRAAVQERVDRILAETP